MTMAEPPEPAISPPATPGRLYLVPMPLGDQSPAHCLPVATLEVVGRLGRFIVENARTARRFLSQVPLAAPIQAVEMSELNEHSRPEALPPLLQPILAGEDVGLVSEAGCPVVADPGASLVALAHSAGIRVVPLVGPSAPLLALMASGFSGQSFRFSGYLPQQPAERRDAILRLESESRRGPCTQVFIETPYRNSRLLEALLDACDPATIVAVVLEVTLPGEEVIVRTVHEWRRQPRPPLDRRPAVFLLSSPPVSAAARPRRRPS